MIYFLKSDESNELYLKNYGDLISPDWTTARLPNATRFSSKSSAEQHKESAESSGHTNVLVVHISDIP